MPLPNPAPAGYFTSRPASKGYIRGASAYLQGARQLEAFVGPPADGKGEQRAGWQRAAGGWGLGCWLPDPLVCWSMVRYTRTRACPDLRPSCAPGPTTDALEEAAALLQHHDAVTGTEKQHVANDYHRRLHRGALQLPAAWELGGPVGRTVPSCSSPLLARPATHAPPRRPPAGLKEAQAVVTSALERLIRGGSGGGVAAALGIQTIAPTGAAGAVLSAGTSGARATAVASQRRLQQEQEAGGASPIDAPLPLEACDWLNVTACNTTGASWVLGATAATAAAAAAWGWVCYTCRRMPTGPSFTLLSRAAVRLSGAGRGILLAAHNPLAWGRQAPLRVPLNSSRTCNWRVTGKWVCGWAG